MTFACALVRYVFPTPAVNAPNVAGSPAMVSDSVAGTLPFTVPSAVVWRTL